MEEEEKNEFRAEEQRSDFAIVPCPLQIFHLALLEDWFMEVVVMMIRSL